uniref:Malto-oligosyltrehalose trehalohydrolase n=1 Tax=Cupriavidus pinatubonensis (strain JMP 134 / LMG 1197) TaxID=264198 RepID=Q46TE8_CUPPJ
MEFATSHRLAAVFSHWNRSFQAQELILNLTSFFLGTGATSATPRLAPLDSFSASAPQVPAANDDPHSYAFGPVWLPEGRIGFRLWAPDAAQRGESVRLEIAGMGPVRMTACENGWYRAAVPCADGTRYWFRLDDGTTFPDPASRWQPNDVHGPSVACQPKARTYPWKCPDWRGRPWHEAVICELHVGLCGGYAGAMAQLQRLSALGFTAVELMPLAEFPGARNWGYDGVLPFAPESGYGKPDDLRALVDEAHSLGMMVLLDVVYNHFGPEGNYLHHYASAFFRQDRQTPWGPALDFRRREVRRFFTENARYWLEEFRFDGLRLDAVHAIDDEGWLTTLPSDLRALHGLQGRHVHLVLENDHNDASLLSAGFDAQWNDDAHHALHVLLTGEQDGYYRDYGATPGRPANTSQNAGQNTPLRHLARVLREGFAYQGEVSPYRSECDPAQGPVRRGKPSGHLPPTAFVSFLQNHDQIGNRAFGDRLATLADPDALRVAVALQLLCPQVPLVFMGEECGAQTPFYYFTSHPPELAEAVRQGRRQEFAGMAAFRDESQALEIPDPNDPATFEASRPPMDVENDWTRYYRRLLAIRREWLMHRLPRARISGVDVLGPAALRARWRLGDGTCLSIWVNLGEHVAACQPPAPGYAVLHETASGHADAVAGGSLPAMSCIAILSGHGEQAHGAGGAR